MSLRKDILGHKNSRCTFRGAAAFLFFAYLHMLVNEKAGLFLSQFRVKFRVKFYYFRVNFSCFLIKIFARNVEIKMPQTRINKENPAFLRDCNVRC